MDPVVIILLLLSTTSVSRIWIVQNRPVWLFRKLRLLRLPSFGTPRPMVYHGYMRMLRLLNRNRRMTHSSISMSTPLSWRDWRIARAISSTCVRTVVQPPRAKAFRSPSRPSRTLWMLAIPIRRTSRVKLNGYSITATSLMHG